MPISIFVVQTAVGAGEKVFREQLDKTAKGINDTLESIAKSGVVARPEITWLQSTGQNFTRLTAIIRW